MQKWGPFTRYENPDFPGAISLRDPDGHDFYELRNTLAKADAASGAPAMSYLLTQDDGTVVLGTNDVDLTFPQGFTLAQVPRLADVTTTTGQILGADGTLSPAPKPPVTSVTRTQGLIQLHRAGLFDAYNQAVAAADVETQIWATNAPVWTIANANLTKIAAVLKLTPDQVQDLFTAGSQIE